MSEELRKNYLRRIQQHERGLRELVAEIRVDFGGDRTQLRNIDAELQVLLGSIEGLLFLAEHNTLPGRDLAINRIHEKADEIIRRKAEAARHLRELYRTKEDMDIERRQLTIDQLTREMGEELPE